MSQRSDYEFDMPEQVSLMREHSVVVNRRVAKVCPDRINPMISNGCCQRISRQIKCLPPFNGFVMVDARR
jgi:hypothetical protein